MGQIRTFFEVPTVSHLMPIHTERYLCSTILNHARDDRHKQLLIVLRKHASYASADAHRTSRQKPSPRVMHGAGTADGGSWDVGHPRMHTPRPRLKQRWWWLGWSSPDAHAMPASNATTPDGCLHCGDDEGHAAFVRPRGQVRQHAG